MIYFCVRVYNFPGDILYAVFETKHSQSGEHSFSFYLTLYKKKMWIQRSAKASKHADGSLLLCDASSQSTVQL